MAEKSEETELESVSRHEMLYIIYINVIHTYIYIYIYI
jgi:hypothetical protein